MKQINTTQTKNNWREIGDVESKIHGNNGLVITIVLNTKIGEFENKIPDVSGLVTTTVLNTKVCKIPYVSVSDLVKKS